jgi:hypothetical protein
MLFWNTYGTLNVSSYLAKKVRAMVYTLWDIETNNLVAERTERREALALVMQGIKQNGPHDTDALSLDVEDDQGQLTTVAYGAELAELARREFPAEQFRG